MSGFADVGLGIVEGCGIDVGRWGDWLRFDGGAEVVVSRGCLDIDGFGWGGWWLVVGLRLCGLKQGLWARVRMLLMLESGGFGVLGKGHPRTMIPARYENSTRSMSMEYVASINRKSLLRVLRISFFSICC